MSLRTRRLAHFARCARPRACCDQSGITLIEVLVGLAVLAITLGAVLSATLTSTRGGSTNSRVARMNVLLSAFGEAVKNLPYEPCATAAEYQGVFDKSEDALQNTDQDLRDTPNAELKVLEVVRPGGSACNADGTDFGVQTIKLQVTVAGRSLTGQITKRNPAPSNVPIEVKITVNWVSALNDLTAVVRLSSDSSSPNGLIRWEWWCNGDWVRNNQPEPSFPGATVPDYDGPDYFDSFNATFQPTCSYPAPNPPGAERTVALRVTDSHNVTAIGYKTFPLHTTPWDHQKPVAVITEDDLKPPQPDCTVADPCDPNVDLSWKSASVNPPDATLVQWRWTFGDGTPPVVCVPPNRTCSVTHRYQGRGTFSLSLTVTDSLGATGITIIPVTIKGQPRPKPTAGLTSSLSANPAYGVAPTRVSFDASGSHADGVAPGVGAPRGGITMYTWEFGDGSTQSGATLWNPSHTYSNPGTYVARVTVEATNGATNFSEVTTVLGALEPPINLRISGKAKADIPFFQDSHVDFLWINVPRTTGDQISYEIMVSVTNSGFCSTFGQGANGRVFTVPSSGPAGTFQTYRANFGDGGIVGLPPQLCRTDHYEFRSRTVRTPANLAPEETDWNPPLGQAGIPLPVEF